MSDLDALIIGGGISGLATAWRLARRGLQVEVWEASSRPGGKILSRRHDGYLTEHSASICLNFRPEVTHFLQQTGLDAAKTTSNASANRYLLYDGRLQALPMSIGRMLASPLWSWRGKLRLALEPFIRNGSDPQETVSQFITRRLGSEMLERAMEPFVAGPLASDADRANAYTALPRLTALERRYGSLTAGVFVHRVLRRRQAIETESFSFAGGMTTLTEWLSRELHDGFRPNHAALSLEPQKDGWRVIGDSPAGERSVKTRQVILSTPAQPAAGLISNFNHKLAKLISQTEYAPLSVVHLGFERSAIRHPLDGNGFLAPRGAGLPITGCQWMTSLFPGRAPRGKVLLSTYLGGARRPDAAEWDDQKSLGQTLTALNKLLGIKSDPEMVYIDRHSEGLPQYFGRYHARSQMIAAQVSRHQGLHLVGNYLGGVSIRDRILCAGETSAKILDNLGIRPGAPSIHSPAPLVVQPS